ncbi:MAG: hypothetical protein QW261_16470 [Candidatus Jordarchaeaceae archaeon]
MQQFKVVVAGPRASGKTEIVSRLAEKFGGKGFIHIDAAGSTVCMDYTYFDVNGSRFHFFGTPGADQFSVVRKSLSKGLNALLLVVNNEDPDSLSKARAIYEEVVGNRAVPTVVAVNEKKSEASLFLNDVKNVFNVPDSNVITVNAKSGEGVEKLFSEMIKVVTNHYFKNST